jgi:multiple sugar transport system substrate-binding protein
MIGRRVLVALLVLGLGACAKDRRDETRVSVSFVGWGAPEERGVMAEALAELERAYPNIDVNYTQVPGVGYDYLNKLRLMIVAGMAPDVFYVPDGAFSEIVRGGALLDLEPFLATSALDLNEIWPTALDRYRFDGERVHVGTLYALPKDLGPMAMFYNADLFRTRGVPPPPPGASLSWSEAVAMWRKLTFEDGGIERWGLTGFPYDAAVWSSGGDILSPDGSTWAMTSPASIAAFQWCADLALREKVAPNPTRLGAESALGTELFEAGLAATHIDGRWMVPRYRHLPFDWDVAPIPVPVKGAQLVTRSGSVGFAVSAKSRHPKEAFTVVEYLAGPRGQAILTATGLQLPNQRDLATTDVFLQRSLRPAHAEVFVEAAEASRPGPATQTPNAFWADAFAAYAEEVWRGDRKAADLFPEIKPRIDQALRAAREEARHAP